jgi:hypothetical protein
VTAKAIWWAMWRDDVDGTGDSTTASGIYTNSVDVETGKRPSAVILVKPWYSGGYVTFSSFSSAFATIRTNGQIPILNWAITSWSGTPSPALTLANIAAGLHDTFLQGFADAIKALGYPVMIILGEEINLSGNPWYDATGTNYIAMYKHVVDLFDGRGATNVAWCWDVNGIAPGGAVSTWWPGNKASGTPYVQWALMDVFNTSYTSGSTWITFDNIMASDSTGQWGDTWDALLALNTTGQVHYGIGSFGSEDRTPTGTNNFAQSATWVTDAFGVQIPNTAGAARDYSKLELVAWFDQNEAQPALSDGQQHWNISGYPLGTNTARQAAFRGPNGPGAGTFYVAGGQFLLPAGMGRLLPYKATPQVSRFTNAILQTAPNNLVGYWKGNASSGTTDTDFSSGGRNGTFTGTAGTNYTLNQPKVIPGTLDLATLFDGTAGYITVPSNAAFSLPTPPTLGALTLLVTFTMVALPGSFATLFSKAGGTGGGAGFEWALRVLASGGVDAHSWNLAGADYAPSSISAGGVGTLVGVPALMIYTIDQNRSPLGRLAAASLGAASLAFSNSAPDTLTNVPSPGTGTVDTGRRGDNSQYANAIISHRAIWNVALNDASMNELWNAFSTKRPGPRAMVS